MTHKICFIVHELLSIGGEQTVLIRVANALSDSYDVTIYTHEKNDGIKNDSVGLSSNVHVSFVPLLYNEHLYKIHQKTYRYYRYVIPYRIIRKHHKECLYPQKMMDYWKNEINRRNYTHVITVSGSRSYSRLMSYIKDVINAKVIAWEHSSYEAYFSAKNCYYYGEESEFSLCWKRLDALVFLNEDIKEKFNVALGVTNGIVIKNPRPFESEKKSNCNTHTIISVGRLEREKGIDDIIRAFSNLYNKCPSWKLVIVGDGTKRRQLEKLVESMNIVKAVKFVGFQRDVRDFLLNASIFVMASKWEGMPMTVLEAMECGLPIVGYRIPALKEMLIDEKDAFLVGSGDIEALENRLVELANDNKMRVQMGESASHNASNYALEAIIPMWKKLLR